MPRPKPGIDLWPKKVSDIERFDPVIRFWEWLLMDYLTIQIRYDFKKLNKERQKQVIKNMRQIEYYDC